MGTNIIRPLGHLETYHCTRQYMSLYPFAAQTCQYTSPSSMSAETCQQVIKAALVQVVLAHPALQVGIGAADTNEPCFLRLPSLDISNHLEWRDLSQTPPASYDDAVVKVIEAEHTKDWQDVATRPAWKLTVVQSPIPKDGSGFTFDFLFAAHHSVADGKSLSFFHTSLLAALDEASRNPVEVEDFVALPTTSALTPSQEDIMEFKISKSFLIKTLWGEFAPSWLQGKSSALPWTGAPISLRPQPQHTRLITFPEEVVSRILEACRSHKTTITPLLQALIATSMSQRLPEETMTRGVAAVTVIGLRPYADKSKIPHGIDLDRSMGDITTAYTHKISPSTVSELRDGSQDPDDSAIWALTTKLGSELKKRLAKLPEDDILGLLAWVSDWFKRAKEMQGKPRDATWEVSNLGSMPCRATRTGAGNDGWKLRRSIFTQSGNAIGPAFAVNVSSIAQGPLTLALTWQEGIVEGALMDGLAKDLDLWCKQLQKSGKFTAF
ncbi:hypothetical protein N7474_000145 [Penicillium riverlandense]|uniref:uncharacterized protein n=1 Tax=Penicillium riverlandense TaxID=1903569 RepID=UPI002547192F|nr:uncharacterized protein N7474_000145 [Penicillium riverlandense]KAJ5831834.1 hypothetical protein N7474_000145 [Penicillium riverlandense]